MWKPLRVVSKGDYNYVVVPDHPNRTKKNYVLEHRIVMENHLGRLLESHEIVHHINGDKKDNRLENLMLMTSSEHRSLHGLEHGRSLIELRCPYCGVHFIRRRGATFLCKGSKWSACSKKCSGKFSSMIQYHGLTPEVESAISGNIVREFNSLDNREETF